MSSGDSILISTLVKYTVPGTPKGVDHKDDATLALAAYLKGDGEATNQGAVLNMAAAIAIRAGHKADISANVKIVRV